MADQVDIIAWLAGKRRQYGLSQRDVAEALGTTRNTIFRWESPAAREQKAPEPGLSTVMAWARAIPLTPREREELAALFSAGCMPVGEVADAR